MLRAVVRMATEVAAQPVRWLWEGRLALGKIAVVAGAANVGKSLLVTGDFAARVSVGADFPVGDVLIASGHDGAADTIVPRLLEHGADLRRVHFLEGFARADGDAGACTNHAGPSGTGAHLLLTPGGVPLLDRALRRLPEVKLIVIDPSRKMMRRTLRPAMMRSKTTRTNRPCLKTRRDRGGSEMPRMRGVATKRLNRTSR